MYQNPSMDIAICGPLRSGTTLLADLLTVPGKSLVISEPDLHVAWHARTVARLQKLYADAGLDVAAEPPERTGKQQTDVTWFSENIVPQLERLDLWGVKQVDFHHWERLFKRFPPRRLVLVSRDLRDFAISSLDLIGRSLVAFPGGKLLRDEAWVLARLASDMHEMDALAKLPHLHLRYEDFVAEEEARERLRRFSGVPVFGEDRFNLEDENPMRAGWEKDKHQGRISNAAVGRYAAEPDGPAKARATRLWRVLEPFARQFGHELPDRPVADHPFVVKAKDGANPVRRVQDIETWDATCPAVLEPAFALRAARIAVAKAVAKPCAVLDLFCGAPSLRFLLKEGSSYRGADLASRFKGCEVFDLAGPTLPPARDAEVVTVLGALEFLPALPDFLDALCAMQVPVLASYHATDDTPGVDRVNLGWRNHLDRRSLVDLFAQRGFKTDIRWAFDGRQSLIKATPA
jgi:hypothetical protein